MKTFYRYLCLAIAIAGCAQLAQALPTLRIFDGTTTLTITDNGAGDTDPATGRVLFNGAFGSWTFNTHVGTSYPVIGSLAHPQVDLSFNAVSSFAGTLTLSYSADGFGPSGGSTNSMIGGATAGSVSYQAFGGLSNTLFDVSTLLTTQGPFTGAFGSSVTGGSVNNAGPYSLTQQVTITHNGAGITTGNALLSVPESGTSVLLLGVGLLALAGIARLRTRTA